MKLNFKVFGEGEPIFILHGLLGSLDNWQTIAKQLSEEYKVYIVDQRNHGKSPHLKEMNYKVMADDLLKLMDDENVNTAHLIGHSMGGKTVMQFALQHPERVRKLVVVDIAPKAYTHGHDHIFEGLFYLNLNKVENREDADKMLEEKISDWGIRQFLLKNLTRTKDGYKWKMNLDDIRENYDAIIAEVEHSWVYDQPTLFIRGGKSDYIQEEDHYEITSIFTNAEIKTIEKAGHWVHAEAPEEFLKIVKKFLRQ